MFIFWFERPLPEPAHTSHPVRVISRSHASFADLIDRFRTLAFPFALVAAACALAARALEEALPTIISFTVAIVLAFANVLALAIVLALVIVLALLIDLALSAGLTLAFATTPVVGSTTRQSPTLRPGQTPFPLIPSTVHREGYCVQRVRGQYAIVWGVIPLELTCRIKFKEQKIRDY